MSRSWGLSIRLAAAAWIMIAAALACQAGSFWHKDAASALGAARASQKPIFVFVHAPKGTASANIQKWLADPALAPLLEGYELLWLDVESDVEQTARLGIFKGGVVVLYDKDGQLLQKIGDFPSQEELSALLRRHGRQAPALPPAAPLASTPAATPAQSPAANASPAGHAQGAARYRKKELISGPMTLDAKQNQPLRVCRLAPGAAYVLVVEGACRLESESAQAPQTDGAFSFGGSQASPVPSRRLKTLYPASTLYELMEETLGGQPAYNPDHVYEALVKGTGKYLSIHLEDPAPQDNSGALKVTVYQAELMP